MWFMKFAGINLQGGIHNTHYPLTGSIGRATRISECLNFLKGKEFQLVELRIPFLPSRSDQSEQMLSGAPTS